MMIRRLFVGLACAGTLAAQTFIQMSDPQFGMFTKNASFEHETVNLELAIASANRPRRPGGQCAHGRRIGERTSRAPSHCCSSRPVWK